MAKNHDTNISLEDKFTAGYFSIADLIALKRTSRTVIYEDIAAKRLPIEKFGRATRVAGRIARDYVPGRGLISQHD